MTINKELNQELNRIATEDMKDYETNKAFDIGTFDFYKFVYEIAKTASGLTNVKEKSVDTMEIYLENMEKDRKTLTDAIEYLQEMLKTHAENTEKMHQFINDIHIKTANMKQILVVEIEKTECYDGTKNFYFNITKQTENGQYVFANERWTICGVKAARTTIEKIEAKYGTIDIIKGDTECLLKATKLKYNIAA